MADDGRSVRVGVRQETEHERIAELPGWKCLVCGRVESDFWCWSRGDGLIAALLGIVVVVAILAAAVRRP